MDHRPLVPGWFEVRGTGWDSFLPFIVFVVIAVSGVLVFRHESRLAAEDL